MATFYDPSWAAERPDPPKPAGRGPMFFCCSIIGVVLFLLGSSVICAGIGLMTRGSLGSTGDSQQITISQASSVLDTYYRAMRDRNTDAAYALLSEDAKTRIGKADLDAEVSGPTYGAYATYRSVKANQVLLPRDTRGFRVEADVTYESGPNGICKAEFVLEGRAWRIDALTVSAPHR